jgi:hypothetical protein
MTRNLIELIGDPKKIVAETSRAVVLVISLVGYHFPRRVEGEFFGAGFFLYLPYIITVVLS